MIEFDVEWEMRSIKRAKLPSQRIEIDGLKDFKSILDFDDSSKIVAVISHPGWKSYNYNLHNFYQKIKAHPKFENISDPLEVICAKVLISANLDYHKGRQILLERELFEFLAKKKIPTIVTVAVKPYYEDEEKLLKHSVSLAKRGEDFVSHIFNSLKYQITKAYTPEVIDYILRVKGERDNFYIMPTDYSLQDEDSRRASGFLFGDLNFNNLQLEHITSFLGAVSKKKVLIAGSNLFECIDAILGYLSYVECSPKLLMNYCGVSPDYSPNFNISGVDTLKFHDGDFNGFIKENPNKEQIRKLYTIISRKVKENLLENLKATKIYKPVNPPKFSCFYGFV